MKIHPTAIIDPKAELHETVEVGPYSVIDADVQIGAGTVIETHVRIYSGSRIGKFNRIHHATAIGGPPQNVGWDLNIKSGCIIGDNNVMREYFNMHRSQEEGGHTTIGNGCFLMENVTVSHDSHLGNNVIMVHAAATSGHVDIRDNAFVSGLSAIHQFCTIGENSMIGGCSKIVKDIPPYATADGNPATVIGLNAIGLKRAGFSPEARKKIKDAYKVIYHSNLNISQALKQLAEENDPSPEVQKIRNFFEKSERGVTDHR